MKAHSSMSSYPSRLIHNCLATVLTFAALGAVPIASAAGELLVGSASGGRLVLFSSDDPEDVAVIHITGLQPNEEILGLDVRPATGELYGLGGSSRLYTIDLIERTAHPVGTNRFTPALQGVRFGFDFNPTVDRIRIVSDTGQNLRAHPVTGVIVAVDGGLAYGTNDAGFGVAPMAVGAAYNNNDNDPATGTMLFNLDASRDVLVLQNPPNAGVLTTVGSLGVDASDIAGFDVAASDGTAYANLINLARPGRSNRAGLYTIDLETGAATFIGKIGGPKPLLSLATLGTMP